MRISILSPGTTGDVHPYIALGAALKNQGHEVLFATNCNFADLVKAQGLLYFELPGNPEAVLASDSGEEFLRTPSSPIELVSRFSKLFLPFINKSLIDSLPACRSTNAIIASSLAYYGYDIAQALNVPFFPCSLFPLTPTAEFPFPLMQSPVSLGGFANQMSYAIARQVFWQFMRDNINTWRQEYLNLPPVGIKDEPTSTMDATGVSFLYGYSPFIAPRPADWPVRHQITGYWLLPPQSDWQPDEALRQFISRQANIVLLQYGTMSPREFKKIANLSRRALALADLRGVLLTDLPPHQHDFSDDRLHYAGTNARDWLLSQANLAVQHCDTDTSSAIMCAGLPSVAIPIFGDQFFWARKMEALGLVTPPLAAGKLSAELLACLMNTALNDKNMQQRATEMKTKLHAENGVANVVSYLTSRLT